MDREFILKAIEKSGLQRIHSCCSVDDKFCATDEWRGNLEGFAEAVVGVVVDACSKALINVQKANTCKKT
jgi:hypothetical protein